LNLLEAAVFRCRRESQTATAHGRVAEGDCAFHTPNLDATRTSAVCAPLAPLERQSRVDNGESGLGSWEMLRHGVKTARSQQQ
jgi:hypothetical protein